MPDAMETIYQSALVLGRHGAVSIFTFLILKSWHVLTHYRDTSESMHFNIVLDSK